MKILSLTLRNINSLAGSFSVDFSHPVLQESGIFLITGPTGSGKSTLLDAIAYALYGATPRQKKITQSVNEIMSRDFKDCHACVVFEHEGVRYAVSTTGKRSSGKNPFAQDKRRLEIISAQGEHRTIANKEKEVKEKIGAITGMPNVEAFCRCMLLAQGAFARFLTMDEKERAELLSTITQTQEYADIGAAVHEHYRTAEEEYNKLQAEEELPAELRAATEATAAAQQKAKETAAAAVAATELGLRWWKEANALRTQHATALEEKALAAQALEDFTVSGNLARLEAARRAAEIAPVEQARLRETARRIKQKTELVATCEGLAALVPQLDAASGARAAARDAQESAKPELEEKRRRIEQELRPAEQQLRTDRTMLAERRKQTEKAKEQFLQRHTASRAAEQALADFHEQRKRIEQRLAELKRDAELPEKLSDIKALQQAWTLAAAQVSTLPPMDELILHREALLNEKKEVLGEREPIFYQKQVAELTALQRTLTALSERLARLADAEESRTRAEQTLAACDEPYANASKKVENCSKREKLLSELAELDELLNDCYNKFCEGEYEVCPCCGSKTPGIRPNVEENQLTEARKLTREAKKELAEIDRRRKDAERQLAAAKAAEETLTTDIGQLRKHLAKQLAAMNMEKEPEDMDTQIAAAERRARRGEEILALLASTEQQLRAAAARDAFHAAVRPFVTELPASVSESKKLLRELGQRSTEYTALCNAQQNFAPLEEEKTKAATAAREAEENADKERKAAETREQAQRESCKKQEEALRLNWQGKSADELTKEYQAKENALNRALTEASDRLATLRKREAEFSTRRRTQEQTLQEIQLAEAEQLARFENMLNEKGFADEESYRTALLSEASINTLTDTLAKLRDTHTAAQAKLTTLSTSMERHRDRRPTQDEEETLLARQEDEKTLLAEAEQALIATLTTLRADDEKRERNRRIAEKKQQRRATMERWALLKNILGKSQDSFQKYAQTITFDALIASANRHLARLYPRFILKQTDDLSLSVTDLYLEEHETRTVSNLSGGESFIVSLALALGLSGLRNSRVSIDTLFLDEGFGTLDPENLHRVLQALEQLRMDGKLIGIITHVEAMKATFRDDCILQVRKCGTGGYSTLCPHPAVKAAPQHPAGAVD